LQDKAEKIVCLIKTYGKKKAQPNDRAFFDFCLVK